MNRSRCPLPNQLLAYALGTLDETTAAGLEDHLAECTLCEQSLRVAEASSESFFRALRIAGQAAVVGVPGIVTKSGNEGGQAAPPAGKQLKPAACDSASTVRAHASREGDTGPQAVDAGLAGADDRSGALPDRVGDYELLEEIARGGMGRVYKARQARLNRIVAVKMILSGQLASEEEILRFQSEAEATARLDHPGIVPIYEVSQDAGRHYFSMAYVDGTSLGTRIAAGPLPPIGAARLVQEVAEAVQYAHDQGIVHRDLKPQNILLTADGRPKVTDFGLAKMVERDSGLTVTGQVLGTPHYMPPEQAEGKTSRVGPLSDIYSLGAVLYHLLTGRPPFQASSLTETLRQVQECEPVPPRQLNPDVNRDLETICLKCLEKEPERRYASAAELAEELQRFLAGEPIRARRPRWRDRLWRTLRRHRVATTCVPLVIVAMAIGVWGAARTHRALRITELKDQLLGRLEAEQWTPARPEAIEALLHQLEVVDPNEAAAARQRVAGRLAQFINERLRRSRLLEDDHSDIRLAIDWLDVLDPDGAGAARRALEQRSGAWEEVFVWEGDADSWRKIFDPSRVQPASDRGLVRSSDEPSASSNRRWDFRPRFKNEIDTSIVCDGNVQLEAEFECDWEAISQVGLILGGHTFLVTSSNSDGAGQLEREENGPWRSPAPTDHLSLQILRSGTVIRSSVVSPREGRLHITARREGTELHVHVNHSAALSFQDLLPLHVREGQAFGLHWPNDVRLLSVRASRQARAAEPSPLEQGDELYSQGRYSDALVWYRHQQFATGTDRAEQQARRDALGRVGLCLMALDRPAEAIDVFEQMIREDPASDDVWTRLATVHVWLIRLRKQQWSEAHGLVRATVAGYSWEQIAAVVPEYLLRGVVDHYIENPAYRGHLPVDLLHRLEQTVLVMDWMPTMPAERVEARRRLLDVCRYIGRDERASQVASELLSFRSRKLVGPPQRAELLDYCELARLAGRPSLARDRLLQWQGADDHRVRLERARVHAALDEWRAAERDLQDYFRVATQEAASYESTSQAHLLQGFLYARRGDETAAQETWQRGRYTQWRQTLSAEMPPSAGIFNPEGLRDWMMGSLTGTLSGEEAEQFVDASLEVFNHRAVDLLLRSNLVSRKHLVEIAQRVWKTPRGRDFARRDAYTGFTHHQLLRLCACVAAADAVAERTLCGTAGEEQQALVWLAVEQGYDAFVAGQLGISQLLQFGNAWLGDTGSFGWKALTSSLGAELRGPTAYILGQRYLHHLHRPGQAVDLFQAASEDAHSGSLLDRLTREELDRLRLASPETP